MERIQARGMFLFEGHRKFFARGVSYGPFRANPSGEPFPEKDQVEQDLRLIRELGANTLRLYHVPPGWLHELAASFGLRILVGIPWSQHIRFLDSRRERHAVRARMRAAVQALDGSPSVLAYLIGNEIPPEIVRWYGPERIRAFLAELADQVRQDDPQSLVSYANYPMTEYLELDFLDFLSFNVYLHREEALRLYVQRLQNLAAPRPLLVSEFGIDSIREGEAAQAEIVSRTCATAAELGCAGTVVFSYTDEWHTGGFEIDDWAFGLVTRDRQPKPVYEGVRRVYADELPRLPEAAPRVSVVICAYNAERTMEECLESLRRLRYPDYEVIVVDDGSTDGTRAIAERFPEFRLIAQENCGLSVARNVGLHAATGEIVAYTDSDCAVDPHWLAFLVHRLRVGDVAGVGGPNLPPAEDHWMPEVVARSPGGPTHVLLTDHEAEHVPGCNMAFWRRTLLEVGGFDPIFHAAGDDVDICWRLQSAGHKIGFAASALVWHRRRHTLRAYLKQQRGYGKAEALLFFKHPDRFNQLGHSRWLGRIYNDLGPGVLASRPVVYGGPFGRALFQTLYEAPASLFRHLPLTLEWNAAALVLIALGVVSHGSGFPLTSFLAAGLVLLGISVGEAVNMALQADTRGLPRLRSRVLIALLSYLGPLLRAVERNAHRLKRLSSARLETSSLSELMPRFDVWRRSMRLSYWNETGIEKEACITALVDFLRPQQHVLILDDGWKPWDLSVHRGVWVRGEVKILVQNHGGAKRQVDAGLWMRRTVPARILTSAYVLGGLFALVLNAWSSALLFGTALLATEGVFFRNALHVGRTFLDGVTAAFRSLPVAPLAHHPDLEELPDTSVRDAPRAPDPARGA